MISKHCRRCSTLTLFIIWAYKPSSSPSSADIESSYICSSISLSSSYKLTRSKLTTSSTQRNTLSALLTILVINRSLMTASCALIALHRSFCSSLSLIYLVMFSYIRSFKLQLTIDNIKKNPWIQLQTDWKYRF